MKPTHSKALASVFSLLCALAPVLAADSKYEGCFSSSSPLTDQGSYTFQSTGFCQEKCVGLNKAVMGTTKGSNCWCGDSLPDASSKVPDSQCNSKCQGYGQDSCGGANAWSVYLTGTDNSVGNAQGSGSGSTSASSSSGSSSSLSPSSTTMSSISPTPASTTPSPTSNGPPSTITKASTVVVTAPGQSSAQSTSSPSVSATSKPKSNTAAIAAGVVVGIVAICAIAGGIFFFLRNRKRRAVEEEYRRNQASTYTAGGGKPTNRSSMSDSRLEPSVMLQRRQSDGSIADNQDYSRRILKVTNPDGT